MERSVALVVNGYLNLSNAQRAEFVNQINEFLEGGSASRDRITKEAINKSQRMDVGPIGSGGCPCCGR